LQMVTVIGTPTPLLADKPYFVTSYVHCHAGLLLFAAPRKMLSGRSLYLLDGAGRVVSSLPWNRQGSLLRDAAGDIWFRGPEQTTLLSVTEEQIEDAGTSIPTIEFDEGIVKIEMISGQKYYFRNLLLDHQQADFYCYDHQTGTCSSFLTITDALGLKLRETRGIFETNEFEKRFGEMCFFRPVFAPMALKGDTVLVFDFTDGKILQLDSFHRIIHETDIPFYQRKDLKRLLIHDVAAGRFYVVFENRGIVTICETDPETGNTGFEIVLPAFPFIEQITVDRGELFFLYNDGDERSYQRIYRMPLGVMMASD
jgi:hypothetical protein